LNVKKQQKDDFTRVFVVVAEGLPRIFRFYALNAHAAPWASWERIARDMCQIRVVFHAISVDDCHGPKLAR